LKRFEPGVEFLFELGCEEILPCGEVAGIGGFEGVVVGLAEVGGNRNRRVASGEENKIHREAGSAAIAIGERVDVGDAVVEPGGALDGIGDGDESGEKPGHEIRDFDRIRRDVV